MSTIAWLSYNGAIAGEQTATNFVYINAFRKTAAQHEAKFALS